MTDRLKIGVLGASGYTGADLVRLAARHPRVEIALATADSHAGKAMGEVFSHLARLDLPPLTRWQDADWSSVDVIFCGLPHGTTQEIVAELPADRVVIDLSADFRLTDPKTYAEWYGHEHRAAHLQGEAVYGLTEHNRAAISSARIIACPGCYPTAALLALLPLVAGRLVDCDQIIIDAKSGVSGAGRGLMQNTLFCEAGEGLRPYGIASHRHAPEIEQELGAVLGRPIVVNFTPHLVPMSRGELVTIHLALAGGARVADLGAALARAYAAEPFVHVAGAGTVPGTQDVRGSNDCLIGVYADRIPGRAIVVAAIDNLVKGSSGQALQNMNVRFGLDETAGLGQLALFP
jgi:N-acetyl-gamma-glutamyl-phosphate reductase